MKKLRLEQEETIGLEQLGREEHRKKSLNEKKTNRL